MKGINIPSPILFSIFELITITILFKLSIPTTLYSVTLVVSTAPMGKVKIAINGFTGIGNLVAKLALESDDVELVAINDPFLPTDSMAYVFKYGSVPGQWKHHDVTVKDNKTLLFGEKAVTVFGIWNPEEIPWAETGAQVIVEPTSVFTDKENAAAYLKGGANRVIIPGTTKDDPILVVGVNGKEYKPDLDGLPPLAKDIRDRLGVVEDLMATVHSFMATQKTVDGPSGKDKGVGIATSSTNIPPITGATKAVGHVLPALNGKFTGVTFRVPTADFFAVDLMDKGINREEEQGKLKSIRVEKPPCTHYDVEMGIKEEEQGKLKSTLDYPEDGMIAPDSVVGNRSSIFGARTLTNFRESYLEFIDRHRNELGYWARVLEVITRAADLTTRGAHLASLAWFTCTRLRGLIAEIAEIFN